MDPTKTYWVLIVFGGAFGALLLFGTLMWLTFSTTNRLFDLMDRLSPDEKRALNWPDQHPFAFVQSGESIRVRSIPKQVGYRLLYWRILFTGLPQAGTPNRAQKLAQKLRVLMVVQLTLPFVLFFGAGRMMTR